MTAPSLPSRLAGLIRDGLVIGSAALFLASLVGTGAWALYGSSVIAFLRAELGIDGLSDQIRTLSGEDRIIRQPRGYSYVEEPVHVGEQVFIVLHMARTQRGLGCTFVRASSIFEDQRGIKLGGSSVGPITQLGANPEAIRVGLAMPQGLQTGRVGVHLVLEYRCDGQTMHDKTDTLFFELLP